MQIELWLMGQNATIQAEYWEKFKQTKWNQDPNAVPIYSVASVVLEDQLDFEHRVEMTTKIIARACEEAQAIQAKLSL